MRDAPASIPQHDRLNATSTSRRRAVVVGAAAWLAMTLGFCLVTAASCTRPEQQRDQRPACSPSMSPPGAWWMVMMSDRRWSENPRSDHAPARMQMQHVPPFLVGVLCNQVSSLLDAASISRRPADMSGNKMPSREGRHDCPMTMP